MAEKGRSKGIDLILFCHTEFTQAKHILKNREVTQLASCRNSVSQRSQISKVYYIQWQIVSTFAFARRLLYS